MTPPISVKAWRLQRKRNSGNSPCYRKPIRPITPSCANPETGSTPTPVLAECQTGGRGRREKSWHSPAGGNIYLSLGWWFRDCQWPLSTLPLIVAIAVCQALARAGLRGHGIKWPNDILVEGKKLAGILVEMQSAGSGPALAVIGVGLNVRMPSPAG